MCPEYNFVPEGKKELKKLDGLIKMTVESTWKFSQRPNLEQLEHENDKMNYNILIFKNPQVYTGRIYLCVCIYIYIYIYIYILQHILI